MDRREFIVGSSAALTVAASGSAAFAQAAYPKYYPADYGALVEASKAEPSVVMYTSFGDSFWNPIKKMVKGKYPWIEIQTLDLGGPEIVERFRMERGASARSADLMVFIGPAEWYELSSKKELIDYKSPEIPYLPDWSLKLPGAYVITVDSDVFVWNKLLLQGPAPTSLEELVEQAKAKPDFFRGRLATYPIYLQAVYFLQFKKLLERHGEKLWTWMEVLGPLTRVQRSGSTMFEKTLVGEYVLSYFISQNQGLRAALDPEKAKIFGWAFPTDGTTLGPRYGGITKDAKAANAARLVLDVLLSKEGQIAVANGGRFSYRPDVTAADVAKGFYTFQMAVDAVGPKNALIVDYAPQMMAGEKEIVDRWRAIYKV